MAAAGKYAQIDDDIIVEKTISVKQGAKVRREPVSSRKINGTLGKRLAFPGQVVIMNSDIKI